MPSILAVRKAFDFEWDLRWSRSPTATFFHGREWAQIWQRYRKYCPVPRVVHFSDGRSAFLPLTRYGDTLHSSPACTYGGWLGDEKLTASHSRLLVEFLLRRPRNLFWRINPFDPLAEGLRIPGIVSDHTHVLDLDEGCERIFAGWAESYRRAARKAEKIGIAVRLAESESDWRQYFGLYCDSLNRWGARTTEVYGWEFFRILAASRSGRIRLWLAWHEGRAVSGALCLYGPKHVSYWHGATLASYLPRHPVQLLFQEIIRDACSRSFRWLDLNPSGGLRGVEEFKSRLGAVRISSPYVTMSIDDDKEQ